MKCLKHIFLQSKQNVYVSKYPNILKSFDNVFSRFRCGKCLFTLTFLSVKNSFLKGTFLCAKTDVMIYVPTYRFYLPHMILSTFLSHEMSQSNDLHGNVDHPIGVKNHQKEIS